MTDNVDDKKKAVLNAEMRKIAKNLDKSIKNYRNNMSFMAGDAPISMLCLTPSLEKRLISHGLFRIYDLFDCDFTEVKGLGAIRIRDLTASLDKFLSML